MRKRILLISTFLAVLLAAYIWNEYTRGPVSLVSIETDFTLNSKQLLELFQNDEKYANKLYLDKILEVEGVIENIGNKSPLTLTFESEDIMSAVVCEMDNSEEFREGLEIGAEVKVKGRCTGFLSDVILVKCVITKIN